MAENRTALLHFSCACKQAGGVVQVPASSLPLSLTFCHCNICRRQTGLLAASYLTLPKEHKAFKINGTITTYQASEDCPRYFCSTCGSNLYTEMKKLDEISLCSGVMAKHGNESWLRSHIFLSDTKDGGMSSWLPTIQGWEGFSNGSKQVDCGLQLSKLSDADIKGAGTQLRGHCYCRSIQFKITRPNEKSSKLQGPFADLLAPYVSSKPEAVRNKDDVKWWLRRQGSKYLAGMCACNSCRTNSGFDIQVWTFIPKVNLFDMHGNPLNLETMQGLSEFGSSEGVHRQFCSKCGATAFWRCDSRPDLIDVSVGLLDAEEGARAESWLEWWIDRISFEEEAPNRTLITSLKSGLKKWGEQNSLEEQ